jgi:hypothetical protein
MLTVDLTMIRMSRNMWLYKPLTIDTLLVYPVNWESCVEKELLL